MHFSLCAFCGDRIGVYEPVVALEPEGRTKTSLAREPSLSRAASALMHAAGADIAGPETVLTFGR